MTITWRIFLIILVTCIFAILLFRNRSCKTDGAMTYNYTKPRRPVAACYSSPGPIYGLPSLLGYHNHDPLSVHPKNPAYTFGHRDKWGSQSFTPGPSGPNQYEEAVVMKAIYPSAPRYSLCGRPKDYDMDGLKVPIAYKGIETDYMTAPRPPAYSMAGRHPVHKLDVSPGPATYVGVFHRKVESKHRRAPSYAIASRCNTGGFYDSLHKSPGPGAYRDVDLKNYKSRPPNYSMGARRPLTTEGTSKPGPGAHYPENVRLNRKQAPRFSFGVRHSSYAVPYIVMVK